MPHQECQNSEPSSGSQVITPVLKLRGSSTKNVDSSQESPSNTATNNNVRWQTDVVDNEHLNKKKTKICCIFHPSDDPDEAIPEENFGQHFHHHPASDSDSDSSSSSSSSDDDEDEHLDRIQRREKRIQRRHNKLAQQDPNNIEPNAYEFQPDYTNRKITT